MYPQTQKTLLRLLAESKVEETGLPLSQLATLSGTSQVALAFDGNKILDDVTQRVREENPLAVYTSSAPINVYNVIYEYLEITTALAEYFNSIDKTFKAVFVFNGIPFTPTPDVSGSAPAAMNPAITQLNSALPIERFGPNILNQAIFKSCAERFNIEEDLESLIVRRIHEGAPDTFRAPYLAWSQISAFLAASNNYVSEAFGSVEMLAFPGIERVITRIDIQNGTFDCITKAAALKAVRPRISRLTDDDFSALLLLECKSKSFNVMLPHGMPSVFEEFSRLSMDGGASRAQRFLASPRLPPDAVKGFSRNLAALEAPVMTSDGQCVLLNELYGRPKTIRVKEFFGAREPAILYYCLFSGVAMPAPYAALCHSVFVEDWPLVDTAFYRSASERVLPLRVQASFQFFQFVRASPVAHLRWLRQFLVFRNKSASLCWSEIRNPPSVNLANWQVDGIKMANLPDDYVHFTDVMRFAECAIEEPYGAPDMQATLSVILLKSLDSMGYFTHSAPDEREASAMCSLSRGLTEYYCRTLSEYGVLLIELVRTQILTDNVIDLQPILTGAQGFPAPAGARFAARAVSIIPINIEDTWNGPFDPEMAAFGTAARLFGRTLRLVTEVNAAIVFATGSTMLPLSKFDQTLQMLPYSIPVEFNAGFLMMHVLLNPECTMASLHHNFPCLAGLEDDLATLFWFWSMSLRALCVILIEEQEGVLMDPTILLKAHDLMGAACSRLCPGCWRDYYYGLEKYTDEVIRVFGLYPQNQMMGPPQQMYNNNYEAGY